MFFPGANSPTSGMNCEKWKDDDDSKHNQDVVMPGFRFHPTEEELVEFYLRRKVEGKHFNIELITLVDLYRYDPWELPALAAIGEKEWFFYVPRDRKYRNGDRPNRVTASGYWKATGADRMIRNENSCCIGLKKTLVFYRGKAPKGKRTSWIMNEYRLPQLETEKIKKSELSLCRVYKKAGTEDDHVPSKESSNLSVKMNENSQSSSAAISDSFNIHPCEPHQPGGSRNAYFNSHGFMDEIMKLEGLPAALQNCDKGEIKRKCSLSVDERFPCQIDNGLAAFENNIHQRLYSDDVHGNTWNVSRPGNEDVQLPLNRCLYSRAPHHVALNTVQDLYNTPSHILGVVANTINNNGSFATNYGSGIQLETTVPGVDYGSISRRYQTPNVFF